MEIDKQAKFLLLNNNDKNLLESYVPIYDTVHSDEIFLKSFKTKNFKPNELNRWKKFIKIKMSFLINDYNQLKFNGDEFRIDFSCYKKIID